MQLDNRSVKVDIYQYAEDGTEKFHKTFEKNISVKFNYEKFIGTAFFGTGKVSICGLDKTTTETLTTLCSMEEALKERKQIKIEAGYGEKKALIIDGSIISANPTMPPDVWIECEVLNGHERKQKMVSVSIEGELNIKEVAEAVALQIGLKNGVECRIKNDEVGKRFYQRKTRNIAYVGTLEELLTKITEVYSFEEGDIYGVPVSYIDNDTLIIDYSNFADVESNKRVHHKIDKDNGMVGLPDISMAGTIANITTLLKPEVKVGDVIDLTSYMIPKANGQYNVIGITYVGDFRGTSWYSVFSCRRINQ